MKTCVIYFSLNLNEPKHQRQLEQLVTFSRNNNLKLQDTFTNFETLTKFLNDENNTTDLLVVNSLKVFGKSSRNCLENLSKIIEIYNLNLYVYQNKMYAKNRDGGINFNFKTVVEVLGLVSKIERGKTICF